MILTKLEDEDGYFFCIHFEQDRRTFFSNTIQECLVEIENMWYSREEIPERHKIIYQIEFENPDDLLKLVPEEFL